MRKNRSRKEEEAYERLMKQQEKLKKNQAVQKTGGSQKYVAAGNKSAYEAGQNSVGSGRQGWIREKNGGIRLQPRKTKERDTGAGSSGKPGKFERSFAKGKRERREVCEDVGEYGKAGRRHGNLETGGAESGRDGGRLLREETEGAGSGQAGDGRGAAAGAGGNAGRTAGAAAGRGRGIWEEEEI
ncbi:hypothetical protein [Christensenella tenuis]|uniref:hypothetical protein n=1 Tax=Christensenella tenuis TaxID=2763033 RepID=UPI001FABCB6D|nr:hypothetical protein [Christensenella tenuis]